MSKEEIIAPYLFDDIEGMPVIITEDRCLQAMQEYADQEVKKDLRDKDELRKAIAEGNATLSRIRSLVTTKQWPSLGHLAAAVLGEIEGKGIDKNEMT